MRLLKKIFFKFFLLKIVFILFFYSKIIFANNANETNLPILERLPTSIFATVNIIYDHKKWEIYLVFLQKFL